MAALASNTRQQRRGLLRAVGLGQRTPTRGKHFARIRKLTVPPGGVDVLRDVNIAAPQLPHISERVSSRIVDYRRRGTAHGHTDP